MKLLAPRTVIAGLDTSTEFESIVREHQQRVFGMLLRLTGNRDNVEDLAQEVFLRLYRGLEHFRGEAQLSTYLYRITMNVAQDEWKRRRKEREAIATPVYDADVENTDWIESFAADAPDAEAQLQQKQLWEMVNEELPQLSEAERNVLVLYHQEDCGYEQIAELLNLPIGTVRTHLHRGRERLGRLVRARMGGTAAVKCTAQGRVAEKEYSL